MTFRVKMVIVHFANCKLAEAINQYSIQHPINISLYHHLYIPRFPFTNIPYGFNLQCLRLSGTLRRRPQSHLGISPWTPRPRTFQATCKAQPSWSVVFNRLGGFLMSEYLKWQCLNENIMINQHWSHFWAVNILDNPFPVFRHTASGFKWTTIF